MHDTTDFSTIEANRSRSTSKKNLEVIRYTREGWPKTLEETNTEDEDQAHSAAYNIQCFKKVSGSLSISDGCLLYGSRVVIPLTLQPQVLQILHLGHLGMQRMKQLARSAVYWPRVDADIMVACRQCSSCAEHQNQPAKAPLHPWMIPEKPWSRIHIDHATNFWEATG